MREILRGSKIGKWLASDLAVGSPAYEVNENGRGGDGFHLSFGTAPVVLTRLKITGVWKMWRSKTDRNSVESNEAKPMVYIDTFGPDRTESGAQEYARKLFQLRSKGRGDEPATLADIASRSQMSARSFKRVMVGEVEPKESVGARIRSAYYRYCEELVARLQKEIEHEQEAHRNAAAFQDLGAQVEALVRQMAEQKAALAAARNRK